MQQERKEGLSLLQACFSFIHVTIYPTKGAFVKIIILNAPYPFSQSFAVVRNA